MMRKSLLGKPLFGLTVLLLLGTAITALIYRQVSIAREADNWVSHTQVILRHVADLNEAMSQAESSQRGFLLTGDKKFLEDYYQQVGDASHQGTIPDKLTQLNTLVIDNTTQEQLLRAITDTYASKHEYMDDSLELAKKSLIQAQKMVSDGKGKQMMDMLHAQIQQFRANERGLLATRNERAEHISQVSIALTFGLLFTLMLIITGAFLTMRTEFRRRQRVETSLQDMSQFQRTILDNSAHAIIATNLDGTIRMFNPAAEKMLGYKAEEVVNLHTPALFHDRDEIIRRSGELTDQLGIPVDPGFGVFIRIPLLEGSETHDWTYIRKDGSRIIVQLCASPLHNGRGEITGFVGLATDITERKQIDIMKNEFISTVSHELRTPLTSIRGALGLISGTMSQDIPEHARQLITIAHKNSERLVRLINNILDIEKIESGNIVFEHRPLDIHQISQNALDEMRGLAEKTHVVLKLDDQAAGIQVLGDEDRLVQVLGNLLSNAIKYSPDNGVVTLTIQRVADTVRLSVHDNGPGIPEQFKSQIFAKFAQADSSSERQKGGSGLGLSISKAIVESMHGAIGFTTEPGHTEFFATLQEHVPTPQTLASAGGERRVNRRVLICEDDADIAALLNISLQQEGFICDIVHTAREAKAHLTSNNYSAMTLDLQLPDQDGLSLVEELRQQARTLHLPIIIISAQAEEGRKRLNGRALGITGWLSKPIDLARLKNLLGTVQVGTSTPEILYIEDESDIIEFISVALLGLARVQPAYSIAEARQLLRERHFDLAILDVKLPDGNGLDLLQDLSERTRPIPVIILSVAETAQEIQEKVQASLVKTVVSEDKIIETIKSLIRRKSP